MAKINSTIFKQETIQSWFSGVGTSVNNEVVQPFQNAEQVIWKYNQAIQHNSLTQQGWERLLAQSDDSLKAYLTSIKGSTASMTGYNVALQGNITGFKKVSSAITQYNALSASGAVEQNTFATAISTTNSRLGTYLTGLNGANASLGGYIISLVGATIKTVALKVATIALNSAVTMGASLIISGIVSAISEWINKTENMIEASEEAVEKIKSINEELKNNQKTISDTAKRYAELAQGVDQLTGKNISLSSEDYEEFLSLSNQLAEMFPTLTRNYNDNGDAIVQLSGDIDTIVGSLQNLIEAQRDLANRQIVDELPTVFDGVAAKSDKYEQQLSDLKSRRDTLVKSLGDVQSEEFSSNFMDGFSNKWIEISGDNLEVISQMRDDYMKILKEANIDFEELTPTYEMKDGIEVPVGFTIKINSSDEDVEKAKNTIDGKIQELASQYETDINKLNEEIITTNEKNKANWTSLSSSIFAWLSTDDSFKVMDDTMQATVQNIVNSLDWGSLDFSSWEDAKQYIQENILSLFNTAEGKETLADIEVMFGIQTQFNNGDITVEQYQAKLQEFLASIESLPPETKKSILLLFGIQTNDDGTTTSDVDTMVENVKKKIKGTEFDDKVGELSLGDLKIAADLKVGDDTIQSWDDLIERIEKVKSEGNKTDIPFLEAFNSSDFSESKEKLLELAKAGELSPSVLESTEEYKTLLSQTGLLADEAYKKIMNLVSVNDRFADMSSDMSNLANAYKEFKEDGFVKASTLDSLEQFKDLKSYKNFTNIVGSKNTTKEQKQKEFNTLATEYLNEERALDKLNETNKDYYITQLKDLGIKNAKIIVEKALNTQEKASNLQAEYRKETGKDLVNVAEELNDATDSEKKSIISATKSFLKMNNATKTARLELFRLNAEEDIFANKDFEGNINLQVEKLFELANAFGVTAAMAKELGIAEDEANRDPLAGAKGYTKADLIHIRESIYKAIYDDFKPDIAQYESKDKSSSSNSSKDSKSKVDWIERKITSITSKIDDLNASYENLFTVKTKNDNISKQLKYQNNLLSANKKAADSYLNAFNGVKLGKDLKNKIINGDYSIKEYSSDNQSLISEAQGYYDNYRKYLKEIENTEKSIRENRIKQNQNIIDYSEAKTAKYEAQLANATKYSTKSKLFKNERAEIRTNYDAQIRNAILNNDKQLKAQLKQQRQTELRKSFKEDFDALQQVYERKISATETKYDNIDKKIQLIETRGATANVSFYQTEKKINATKLTQLNAEKKALEERLNSIKKGTDEYYEAKEAINEVNNSIQECTKSQYELNKAMTDMLVQRYTDRNDAIQRRIDEDEFIQGLYAGQQKMDKDTASFTKYGKADLDIYAANRLRAKAQADNNEELLNGLKKAKKQADGTYKTSVGGIDYIFNSQKELNEAINDTYDKWKDSITSAYDYETKIVDSMKDKYQSQLDLMQELISKKKEALSVEKDLHDYQNTITDKTTNINNLKSQIAAYQGDTSLEGMAKLQQLQKSLKEQEKDLRETEYDRFISDQEKMLDKLYEQYEEKIDAIINDFDLLLKQGIKIAATSDVKNTTAEVINKTANNNGYNTQYNAKDTYNTDNKISTNVKNETSKSNKDSDKLSGTESIQKFIKDNVQNTKIKRKDLSYINQLIYDAYGKKVLSTSNLKKLADLVGVKYNGKTKKGNLYKELHSLKIPGFSKGGVVSVDDLYKQIKSNGDTTLASVKSGEGILTPLQTKQFTSLVSQLPDLNQSVIDYKALTRNIKSNPASYSNNVGDIILNIDLPNVTNPDEFVRAIQSSQKLQKTLQSVTIGMMNSNSTRLGVNRIK